MADPNREYGSYPRPPEHDEVVAEMDLYRPYTANDIYRLFTDEEQFGYDVSPETVRSRLDDLAADGRITMVEHRNSRKTYVRYPDDLDLDWD
jgi:Fe2+ or Zn2+ uptake regulation protein